METEGFETQKESQQSQRNFEHKEHSKVYIESVDYCIVCDELDLAIDPLTCNLKEHPREKWFGVFYKDGQDREVFVEAFRTEKDAERIRIFTEQQLKSTYKGLDL